MIGDGNAQENAHINGTHKVCLYQFLNPNGKYHRFLALIFMCWLGFGMYFCYETPSALQDDIIRDMNITSTQFSLLYALYSWTSVIVCVIGGVLIDSVFGVRLGTIIYIGITFVGQLVFATGALVNAFWVMALGRFVFGLGGEPLVVGRTTYAVAWFKGKELSMVFGLQESCSGIGSVVNFWIMGPLYILLGSYFTNHTLLGIVLLIASLTCIFSMICALILGVIHKRAEPILAQNEECDQGTSKVITFKDVKNFAWSYWLMNVVNATYYMSITPFFALSKIFFMEKFNASPIDANHLSSLLYFVSCFGAPVLGLIIDKVGRNVFCLLISIFCTIAGHSMLAFLSWNPYFGVILISMAKCILTSAFCPIIILVVPYHQLGTAYGLCWSFQNLFIGVATILAGIIVDYAGYIWLEVFFITSSCVSFLATLGLLAYDTTHSGVLNMTPLQRTAVKM